MKRSRIELRLPENLDIVKLKEIVKHTKTNVCLIRVKSKHKNIEWNEREMFEITTMAYAVVIFNYLHSNVVEVSIGTQQNRKCQLPLGEMNGKVLIVRLLII